MSTGSAVDEYEVLGSAKDGGRPEFVRSPSRSDAPTAVTPAAVTPGTSGTTSGSPSGEAGVGRRPGNRLAAAVAAVVLLAGGIALLGPGDWSTPPPPRVAAAEPVLDTDPWLGWEISDAPPADDSGFMFGTICPPELVGADRLRVSFELINSSARAVRLLGVEPQLVTPGMLEPLGTRTGGGCEEPGKVSLPLVLEARDTVLVTMRLRVLKPCPKLSSVGVTLRAKVDSGLKTHEYSLLGDLGGTDFPGCPG